MGVRNAFQSRSGPAECGHIENIAARKSSVYGAMGRLGNQAARSRMMSNDAANAGTTRRQSNVKPILSGSRYHWRTVSEPLSIQG